MHEPAAASPFAASQDLTGIIRSPTLEGNILGRTSFNGTGAAQWNLAWALGPWAPAARPDPVSLPPVGLGWGYPDQRPEALWAVNAADPLAFWRVSMGTSRAGVRDCGCGQ